MKSIVQWREEAALSQHEFATTIDVFISAVSKWERGIHIPTLKMQRVICSVLSKTLGIEIKRADVEWPTR